MSNNRKNIWILFFTMIVVMLGFGMIIPIMPFYVKSLNAGASALGMLMATYGLMQFICAPLWGSLSDRYGRKPILMVGVLGNALAQLLFGLSTQLWMLFAARTLAGLLSSATLPTAMAYISDSTSEKDRGGGMGIIGAAMGLGMVLGPGLGGWLASRSLSFPFFLAAALSTLAFVLIWAVLPEPLQTKNTQREIRGVRFSTLWQALKGSAGVLFLMSFLLTFGLTNFEGIFGLYSAQRYQFGTREVGTLLTVIGLISAVIQGALAGPLTRRFGEVNIIRAALFCTALGFIFMTRADTVPVLWISVCFFVTSNAMLNPSVSALISKRSAGAQGMTMGLNNSFQSLGRIVGPLWAGFAMDIQINMPYFTGALVMWIGFTIALLRLNDLTLRPAETEALSAG